MNWAATGCLGGYLRIWDLVTYQVLTNALTHFSACIPDHCFDLLQCRHVCRHPAGVIKLLWHPSRPIVYTCTVEGLLYVWDARTGQLLKSLAGHTDTILDVALIPAVEGDSVAKLLTASDDESVRLFRVDN